MPRRVPTKRHAFVSRGKGIFGKGPERGIYYRMMNPSAVVKPPPMLPSDSLYGGTATVKPGTKGKGKRSMADANAEAAANPGGSNAKMSKIMEFLSK